MPHSLCVPNRVPKESTFSSEKQLLQMHVWNLCGNLVGVGPRSCFEHPFPTFNDDIVMFVTGVRHDFWIFVTEFRCW